MKNQQIQENLLSFLDGRLDSDGRIEIEKALVENPELAQQLEELKAQQSLLRSTPQVQAPEALWQRVKAELPTPRRFLKPAFVRVAALAAAACLAVVIGLQFMPKENGITGGQDVVPPIGDVSEIVARGIEKLNAYRQLTKDNIAKSEFDQGRKNLAVMDNELKTLQDNKAKAKITEYWQTEIEKLRAQLPKAE